MAVSKNPVKGKNKSKDIYHAEGESYSMGRGGHEYRLRYLETMFCKAEANHTSWDPEFSVCRVH